MSKFRDLVRQDILQAQQEQFQPVQGVIPKGSIGANDAVIGVAPQVRIANPHAGMEPGSRGDGSYLVLHNVRMPRSPDGFLWSLAAVTLNRDIGVLVGFRGGNFNFPFIIQFLSLELEEEREERQTLERGSGVADQLGTAGSFSPPSAAPGTVSSKPPPQGGNLLTAPPASPEAKRKLESAAKAVEREFQEFWDILFLGVTRK